MKKYLPNLILLIIWMFVIFNYSNQNADISSSTSDRLIIKTIETIKHTKLSEEEKEEILDKFTIYIRKGAHLFLYFILAILSYSLLYIKYDLKPITIIYTLIFCFIYACTDELHQTFIPGRSGEFKDVLIDSLGSIIFLIFPTIIYLLKSPSKKSL